MKISNMAMLLTALLLALLAPLASTWSIAIYASKECDHSKPYYAYGGDAQTFVSECTRVGTSTKHTQCMYSSDGGVTSESCNSQIPIDGDFSWGFPDDTTCYLGGDPNCTEKTTHLWTKPKCSRAPFRFAEDQEIYFMCGPDE